MQPAGFPYNLHARPEIKVVRVAEDDLRIQLMQISLIQRAHRGAGADRHERRRLHRAVSGDVLKCKVGEDELSDPIGDESHSPVKGIVHRYPDRVLLTPTLTCPVYCRFCFRREAVGHGLLEKLELERALEYIKTNSDIWEVILSGGDPFTLSARRLNELISNLEKIEHIGVIRIHTRVPIVDPDKITGNRISAHITYHCY